MWLGTVHGDGADTVISDVSMRVDVRGLESPSPFEITATVGGSGRFALSGEATLAEEGVIGAETVRAAARLLVEAIALEDLAPAAGILAPLDSLAGELGAEGELTFDGSGASTARFLLTGDAPRLRADHF